MGSGACGGSERSRRWLLGRGLATWLGGVAVWPVRAAGQGQADLPDEQWGPFRGRVVDADTGEPIPGAVAVVIWLRVIPTPVQAHHEFFDARMAVSGRDGTFEIPRRSPPWLAFTIEPPLFDYYVPDFVVVGTRKLGPATREVRARRRTALPPEERLRMGTLGHMGWLMTNDLDIQFAAQANEERQKLGLPPIPSLLGGTR